MTVTERKKTQVQIKEFMKSCKYIREMVALSLLIGPQSADSLTKLIRQITHKKMSKGSGNFYLGIFMRVPMFAASCHKYSVGQQTYYELVSPLKDDIEQLLTVTAGSKDHLADILIRWERGEPTTPDIVPSMADSLEKSTQRKQTTLDQVINQLKHQEIELPMEQMSGIEVLTINELITVCLNTGRKLMISIGATTVCEP